MNKPSAANITSISFWVSSIILLAASLRFWGISFGLPYDFNPDEVHEILRALKLGNGEYSLSPWKGGLYLILFLFYGALYVIWRVLGVVSSPEDFALAYLSDPTPFFLIGRATVALMGTFTCYLVYKIAEKIFGYQTAIIALLFISLSLYHVLWSHYINVDIGMILFIFLAFYWLLCFNETRKTSFLLGSAAASGLAFAFKLPGLLAVLIFFSFALSQMKSDPFDRNIIKTCAQYIIVFIITSAMIAPENYIYGYTVLGMFESILSGLVTPTAQSDLAAAQTQIDSVTIDIGSAYHEIMLRSYNLPLTILTAVGLWCAIRNKKNSILGVSVACGIYVAGLYLADRPGSQRYLLPIFPLICILSAYGVYQLSRFTRIRVDILTGSICLFLAMPAAYEVYMLTRPDTRIIAKSYIEEHIPRDTKILVDGMRHRMIHSPPINPNAEARNRWAENIKKVGPDISRGVSSYAVNLFVKSKADLDEPSYDIYSTLWGLGVEDLDFYVCEQFAYVVLSETIAQKFRTPTALSTWPVSARFYQGIRTDERFVLEYRVSPAALKMRGPVIEIYRVQGAC